MSHLKLASIKNIFIYPIKSLNRISVAEVQVLNSGALANDRRWALVDDRQKIISAKTNSKLHHINFLPSKNLRTWTLAWRDETSETFDAVDQRQSIESWFSSHLGKKISLIENCELGFPDDIEANGPTLLSDKSLDFVTQWYKEIDFKEISLRFRANLELCVPSAFWEDRLVGLENAEAKKFNLSQLTWQGLKICQRCVVPSRDSQTGETLKDFIKTFSAQRSHHLPSWSEPSRFNHFYRLGVNTKLISKSSGHIIKVGDSLTFPLN